VKEQYRKIFSKKIITYIFLRMMWGAFATKFVIPKMGKLQE
jgi:hypothetical protein